MKKQMDRMMEDMDFLLGELHKEWDRTGADRASVFISLDEVREVNGRLAERIRRMRREAENPELSFKECILKTKEGYVLLRLVRKITEKEDRLKRLAIDNGFWVELDAEEKKLFYAVFKEDAAHESE